MAELSPETAVSTGGSKTLPSSLHDSHAGLDSGGPELDGLGAPGMEDKDSELR